jgi:hypothetical protein
VVEGARLESVFRGNSNVGSNPTSSAILHSDFRYHYGFRKGTSSLSRPFVFNSNIAANISPSLPGG